MYKNIFLPNFLKNTILINFYKIRFTSKEFNTKLKDENANTKKLNDFRSNFRHNLNYSNLKNSSSSEINNDRNLIIRENKSEQTNKIHSKIVPKTTNFYVRQDKDNDSDLIPQQDLVADIRAKGIFERDPNDKESP